MGSTEDVEGSTSSPHPEWVLVLELRAENGKRFGWSARGVKMGSEIGKRGRVEVVVVIGEGTGAEESATEVIRGIGRSVGESVVEREGNSEEAKDVVVRGTELCAASGVLSGGVPVPGPGAIGVIMFVVSVRGWVTGGWGAGLT